MFQRHPFLLALLVFVLVLAASACSGKRPPRKADPQKPAVSDAEQMPMPRADPGYLQHMERYSMLAQASEMAKVVSGSELAWRSSASSGAPDAMLGFADTWLNVHPMTLLTTQRSTAFAQLSDSSLRPVMQQLGVRGLFVAPVQGGGALWAEKERVIDSGDDAVQYEFSRIAGDDEQYQRLMRSIVSSNSLLGSDLIPAATGLGPDFFLAARNVREFPGIYCMVEIPEELWNLLPAASSEFGGVALTPSQVTGLNSKGLLPGRMRDAGGWAATGVVRGIDGNNYRWVYRYYKTPEQAILNWEDPSKAANRILSGSAVRQVGLQGQALIGLRFKAFQGLDPAPEASAQGAAVSIEPARTAAQSMSREIRRYGGWSWLRDDNLSIANMRDFLGAGADFIHDGVFSPGAEHALLTGDASLLRLMADEALRLNIDGRRLVHVMPGQDGINYSLSGLSGTGGEDPASYRRQALGAMLGAASKVTPTPVKDGCLYSTGAGLAALALNATTATAAQAKASDIAAGHSLLIFFKAMQPGVLMLAGQDLSGVLPLQWGGTGGGDPAASARGGYGLTSMTAHRAVGLMGTPRAPHLYPPADVQARQSGSFMHNLGAFLKAREQYAVSRGRLAARPQTKGKGVIALLTTLPESPLRMLTVCNFSRESVNEQISLSGVGAALSRSSAVGGGSHSVSGTTVHVTLGPWQGRAIIFGTGQASSAPADGAGTAAPQAEAATPSAEAGE